MRFWITFILVMMCIHTCGHAEAHELHLGAKGQLTKIEMITCDGYYVVNTKETGTILIYKDGNALTGPTSLHYLTVPEMGCIYDLIDPDEEVTTDGN